MILIDIPNVTAAGPSSSDAVAKVAAVAAALSATKPKPPLVQVSVNGDEAILEAVGLIRSARTQMELLTNTINDRLNLTFIGVGDKLTNIINNVDTMTDNIAHSSSNLNQPILFMLFTCVLLLIFVVILLFIILKTRREFRKHKVTGSTSTTKLTNDKLHSSRSIASQIRKHFRYNGKSRHNNLQSRSNRTSPPGTLSIPIGDSYSPTAPPIMSSSEFINAPTLPKKRSSDTMKTRSHSEASQSSLERQYQQLASKKRRAEQKFTKNSSSANELWLASE